MFRSTPLAKYAYVYMAQPLCQGVPPFCLACMGTDNKFTAQHVMLRWKYILCGGFEKECPCDKLWRKWRFQTVESNEDFSFPFDSFN